jgi:hypothetical protein
MKGLTKLGISLNARMRSYFVENFGISNDLSEGMTGNLFEIVL